MKITTFHPTEEPGLHKFRKENHFHEEWALIVFVDGKFKNPLTIRGYYTPSRAYACVWLHDHERDLYGFAGAFSEGYGFHRPSAAVDEALTKMGIVFYDSISGRGDSAIVDAIHAIAKDIGYTSYTIHHAHP